MALFAWVVVCSDHGRDLRHVAAGLKPRRRPRCCWCLQGKQRHIVNRLM
jgi:hypothetical protein